MKRQVIAIRRRTKSAVSFAILASVLAQSLLSQTIENPSFEATSFSVSPGYIEGNAAIPGWTANQNNAAGLNPAGGLYSFANNGAIPNGTNVAFLEWGGTAFTNTINGLTVGNPYNLTFRVNVGTNDPPPQPVFKVLLDDAEVLALNIYPVGSTNPYAYVSINFTATAASQKLTLLNDSGFNEVILLDDFVIRAVSNWTIGPWTGDADSGVDAQYVYTQAYNFASGANATINDVLFTGVAGLNPSVPEKFSTERFGNVFNNDGNTITTAGGGSGILARDFLYSATVPPGSPQTIRMLGLTPGTEYIATIYTVGWEGPSTSTRWATIALGEDRLTFNQDQFDNDNGLKLSCHYTADASGTAEIRIAPINPANVSIHVYGFSNREAVSRNVAPTIAIQPRGTTVSAGVPVTFAVATTGFPAPTYTWRRNGQPLAGTEASYTIPQAQAQDVGNYDVIVANSMGSVTSIVANLIVGIPMTNASFEADAYISWPGYSGDNPGGAGTDPGQNGPITGWTLSDLNGAGINPISNGSSPFADNGAVPNGTQVAFMQADRTLTQPVTLTPGTQYYLHFYENARNGVRPGLEASLGSTILVPAHVVSQVGGANPYTEVFSDVFAASAATADLTFTKSSPLAGDSTLLLDNVAFVVVPAATAPFLVRNPAPQTVSVGANASFSGQAIGTLPITFQWLKDGTPIDQATNQVLTLTNVTTADVGAYTIRVSNSVGEALSQPAQLLVPYQLIPGVFGTGVANDGTLLAPEATDPHYILAESADLEYPGPDAIVVNDGFPIGPWLNNGPNSRWIAPWAVQGTGNAEGNYTYQTSFNLAGYDLTKVRLEGAWAVDNTGTDILVNGVSTGLTSSGFDGFATFTITNGLVAGMNTLDFKVNNLPATPNPTGLRVDLRALVPVQQDNLPRLQATRSGDTLSISWSPVSAGQTLQVTTDLKGSWQNLPGASNPFTTNTTGSALFFRIAQ